MRSGNATRLLVVQVAVWSVALTGLASQPGMSFPLDLKVTVPVGTVVNDSAEESVAVKVTGWSTTDGDPDETTASVMVAVLIVWRMPSVIVAGTKLLSPAKLALIAFPPACRAAVLQVAVRLGPLAATSGTAVQAAIGVVVPFNVVVKTNVPDGTTPAFGVTVAVIVARPFTVTTPGAVFRLKTGVPWLTFWIIAGALAALKLLSKAMLATMEFAPAFSKVVVQVAVRAPATFCSPTPVQLAAMGKVEPPGSIMVKLTPPTGVIPLFGVTVVVKVTEPFSGDVPVTEDVVVSTGVPGLTFSVIAVAVAAAKLVSPVSAARLAPMEFVPACRVVVGQVAVRVGPVPGTSATEEHSVVVLAPSVVVKVTVPFGTIPAFGVTVAVSVTGPFTVGAASVVVRTTTGVTGVTAWGTLPEAWLKLPSAGTVAVIV